MATLPFMPHTDDDKADLLEHIATNLPRYADLLGISPQTLEALKADAVCFRYTLQSMVWVWRRLILSLGQTLRICSVMAVVLV